MDVQLLSHTPNALSLLIATKETRLKQEAGLIQEIEETWTEEQKMEALRYMRGTIQSSWEFVDYTFAITGVSRAFTHQLVRTRAGSYAQQSQRTVDMSDFEFVWPENPAMNHSPAYDTMYEVLDAVERGYTDLIESGIKPEDARSILPTNVSTNIIAKFSLRTLSDMAKVRLCFRTQGEYQNVFAKMRERVIEVHPWAEEFIRVHCAALGVCAFPNWNGCPIKGPVFNPETGLRWDQVAATRVVPGSGEWGPTRPATKAEIQEAWEGARSTTSRV